MGRPAVRLRKDRDRADSEFARAADYAERDFPPVGDKYGFEQGVRPVPPAPAPVNVGLVSRRSAANGGCVGGSWM